MFNPIVSFVTSFKAASGLAAALPIILVIGAGGIVGASTYYVFSQIDYNINKKTTDDRITRIKAVKFQVG